jgi:hypothetical protein
MRSPDTVRLSWRRPAGLVASGMLVTTALSACLLAPSDPGPSGGIAVQRSGKSLVIRLPACAARSHITVDVTVSPDVDPEEATSLPDGKVVWDVEDPRRTWPAGGLVLGDSRAFAEVRVPFEGLPDSGLLSVRVFLGRKGSYLYYDSDFHLDRLDDRLQGGTNFGDRPITTAELDSSGCRAVES